MSTVTHRGVNRLPKEDVSVLMDSFKRTHRRQLQLLVRMEDSGIDTKAFMREALFDLFNTTDREVKPTLAATITSVLNDNPKGLTLAEIAEHAEDAGYSFRTSKPTTSIYQCIRTMNNVEEVGLRGKKLVYALKKPQ